MRRILILCISITVLLAAPPSKAQDKAPDWNKINTAGLYKSGDEQFLGRDIWKNYTQERALQTLDYFPKSLQNPAYRSVMEKLLFADSKPLKEDVKEPLLLKKRLNMALDYGLFDSLDKFYELIATDAKNDPYLSLIPIALIMADGQLAPACLDIQASTIEYGDNPAWKDLVNYCKQRFAMDEKDMQQKFLHFKSLKAIIKGNLSQVPANLSAIETLLIFADEKITPSLYKSALQNPDTQSDLFISLAINDKFKGYVPYRCAVIEAAKRGIISSDTLPDYYTKTAPQEKSQGSKVAHIHRCDMPSYYFNIFDKRDTAPSKDEINTFLKATSAFPVAALTPFAKYLQDYDYNDEFVWRAGTIMAMAGIPIPENAMLTPLIALQNSNHLNANSAYDWFNTVKKSSLYNNFPLDPAVPIYYLRIVSGEYSNLSQKQDNFDYEKLFSLTYGKKSLESGLGKIDALSTASQNEDPVRLFMIAFSKIANHTPNMVSNEAIASILSSLDKYKLKKEKEILAFDALSY